MSMDLKKIYSQAGIKEEELALAEEIEEGLARRFKQIDEVSEFNQIKVINAMQRAGICEEHFSGSTGYGYDDCGREAIEKAYAGVFGAEAALVRGQITCGTHALKIALFGNLRPGDRLLYITGMPYDTLHEVIGIRDSRGSLAEYGIDFDFVDLKDDGSFDLEGIRSRLCEPVKVVGIQRSRGYAKRRSLSADDIGGVCEFIKSIRPDVIIMVDNCYGEFTGTKEPTETGADMVVGSLIKNPGGGLAPTGGYVAGKKRCVENAAFALTAPGLGGEVGAAIGVNRQFAQGLFLAPTVTANALKGALFAAALFNRLGFSVSPLPDEERGDIIQSVEFGSADRVIAFCEGIQAASPVDGFVRPVPAPMPGYESDIIMAAGTFVLGSTIELSADAPIREPYAVYFQGGLTLPHAKFGILKALSNMIDKGLVHLL